jgi:hypothetical protein
MHNVGRDHICDQLLTAGVHHRLDHGRMLGQPGLDLAGLDPDAADLDLPVRPA